MAEKAPREAPRLSRIRVTIADDHPLYREGVVRALAASDAVEVVGEAGDGHTALEQIRERRPDVALIDYKLPDLDGVEIARALAREEATTRVLLLSAFTDGELVYRALQAGAAGYLAKEARREEIVKAVAACARGETVLGVGLASELVSQIRVRAPDASPTLTRREKEILRLMADGMSLPEIAGELHLAVSTVKTHVHHVYEKLEVSDRAAAVAVALRQGMIE